VVGFVPCDRVQQPAISELVPVPWRSSSCHFQRCDTLLAKRNTQHTIISDYTSSDPVPSSPTCYFSLPISLAYYSAETPLTAPSSTYSADTDSDPTYPLLALRRLSLEDHMPASPDASKLLQLQTAAAHQPTAQPMQHSSSSSSNSSNSSLGSGRSPLTLCCCRCRRESGLGMIQFATNLYYCSHCAKMTGYCAG
jgi:hypothetical protein